MERQQVPPLAVGPQQVEQATQQPQHVGRPRAAAGLGGRDQPPLLIGQPLARL